MPPPVAVDSHHHLWDPARDDHGWLDAPEHAPIRRAFDADDYAQDSAHGVAGRPVVAGVVVQALAGTAETLALLAGSVPGSVPGSMTGSEESPADGPCTAAVVGWVDLTGDVPAQIEQLRAAPGGHLLRGVRHLVQDEADPRWLLRPDVLTGLRAVAEAGLVYDVLVRAHQLAAAGELTTAIPQLPLVLDHAGKPPLTEPGRLPQEWIADVRLLAQAPQVVCKVSGLVTEAPWHTWSTQHLQPVWDVLLAAFGPDRLAFGSDWPVCRLAGGWRPWAEVVATWVEPLTPSEQDAVLRATAVRTYSLDIPHDRRSSP